MAIGSIEFTTISRAQEYSTIKHNEDNKGMVDQANYSAQMQKTTEQRRQEVYSADNAQWQQSQPDARDKGKGSYEGDGGRNRKKQEKPVQRVIVKGQEGFDIKV